MIGIRIEFLAGRFHANPWDRGTNEDEVEWPPSPWRLLRAFTAGWYRSGAEDRDVFLRLIDKLAEYPAFELPRATSGHSRHYVPMGGIKNGNPEKTLILDSFLALDRSIEHVSTAYVHWPKVELVSDERRMLERICGAIGYLGRSESWAQLTPVDVVPKAEHRQHIDIAISENDGGPLARRLAAGKSLRGEALLVSLSETTAMMRKARRLVPQGTAWVEYRLPPDFLLVKEQFSNPKGEEIHFNSSILLRVGLQRGERRLLPAITQSVSIADLMRMAAIKRLSDRESKPCSRRLAGKSEEGRKRDGHDHPYFLPGDRNENGIIDHIDVWFPKGCLHEEYMAVSSINALYDSEGRLPATFLGIVEPESAQAWTTATPVVLERFPKMRGPGKSIAVDSAEDQLRAMVRRQFDRDAHIEIWESSRAITRPGGHRTRLDAFRRMRVNKSNVHPPAVGVTITFDEPIRGPIVLGRLAHFGLGRFKPVR